MEVLVLDGKNYVKASKAAKELGYATDYVGQLCRSGQVDAHLIGRTWYVNQEQLGTHRVEKKRISRVKAREQAKKAIEEHRLKVTETKNNYRNIDIQYEEDDRELIPTPKVSPEKKLAIKSESAQAKAIAEAEFEEMGGNIIDNEGDKVLMKGDLTVVDVTDGPSDDDTITLTPRMIRKKPLKEAENDLKEAEISVTEENGESNQIQIQKEERKIPSFTERLGIEPVDTEPTLESEEENTVPDTVVNNQQSAPVFEEQITPLPTKRDVAPRSSVIPYILTVIMITTLVLASLPVSIVYLYEQEDNAVQVQLTYDFDTVFSKIELKLKQSRLNKI